MQLRNRRRDMLFVSLAGPGTNFVLAAIGAVIARLLFQAGGLEFFLSEGELPMRVQIPLIFAAVNLFLGLFNFLPIPPLDGASMIERVLPEKWLPGWYRFRPYGMLVLFLMLFSGLNVLSRIFDPFLERLYDFVLT
jgi:Zn-dependent protease